MLLKRIIPVLIMKNDELIHRSNFDDTTDRYVGDPINAINIFNQFLVDEVILIDIENTRYNKPINFELLKDIAGEAFFPLTYGGGIKNIEDAEKIISLGYEKISINNCFFENKKLIEELSKRIGAQSIVVSFDILKENNSYHLYNYLKKTSRKITIDECLVYLSDLKVGELMITAVDLDGSMKGCDTELIKKIGKNINIPIIYKGGLSNLNEIETLFKIGVNAITSSSLFIMKKKNGGIVLNYPSDKEKSKYEDL